MVDATATHFQPPTSQTDARACLAADHERLARVVTALEDEHLDREPEAASVGELAPASQHPANLASETFERERDLGLLSDFRTELDDNERAATRLLDGTYGVCVACHAPIPPARLAAVPATLHCKDCQDRYELDELLATAPPPAPPVVDDLSEFLPDDDELEEQPPAVAAEEAALHVQS